MSSPDLISLPFKAKVLVSTLILSGGLSFSASVSADVTYGPVKPKDTLGKIVNRFYAGKDRSSVALMKTILVNNPKAFVRGDMNLLKLNALLVLPGNNWLVNEPRFVTPDPIQSDLRQASNLVSLEGVERTPKQMQSRIVFLEAERLSLIGQVEDLKRDTARLTAMVEKLELESRASDDQLRVLDKEIIRLTELLEGKSEAALSSADLSKLLELQQKLQTVQRETERLRDELSKTQTELSNNLFLKKQADQAVSQLTQENNQLQHLLKESRPGVHYFGETSVGERLSLLDGKLKLPLWSLILGGALLSLVMIALVSTRRKKLPTKPVEDAFEQQISDVNVYDSLLETPEDDLERGFAQTSIKPEENVFKMFDEGTLEMDLKLDMAEAYLQMSDFDTAKLVLQEVMEGGSELQQRKATRLMQQAA